MRPRKNLIGKRFERWTVIGLSNKQYRQMSMWTCRCDCGVVRDIIGNNLTRGISKSCGCLKIERTKKAKTTHGDTRNHKIARLYTIWQGMKERCEKPSQKMYCYYGGKGIKVCESWKNYEEFKKWAMANGYAENLTIDRIDESGNYEPSNCRWVTQTEQVRNNSHNVVIEINGVKKCLSEWCEIYNMPYKTVISRIRRDWEPKKAITNEGGK
jgi:hypothetical protein